MTKARLDHDNQMKIEEDDLIMHAYDAFCDNVLLLHLLMMMMTFIIRPRHSPLHRQPV